MPLDQIDSCAVTAASELQEVIGSFPHAQDQNLDYFDIVLGKDIVGINRYDFLDFNAVKSILDLHTRVPCDAFKPYCLAILKVGPDIKRPEYDSLERAESRRRLLERMAEYAFKKVLKKEEVTALSKKCEVAEQLEPPPKAKIVLRDGKFVKMFEQAEEA
ncbi:hypothetical protein DPSP01_003856 [Paraphaeosphaeria sporulosa]